jgi:hypothetical protein
VTAPRRILATLLLAAGMAFAGCGGDDNGKPIPVATASALQTELSGVQTRLNQGSAGACKDILEGPRDPNKERVQELIDALPDDVDSDVRSALQDSFDRLWDLVGQECDDKAQKEEQPEPETNTESTPTETQTETEPTETQTETEPTATDEAPLPNDGDGNGNGNGNGGVGNGNGSGGGVGPGNEVGG